MTYSLPEIIESLNKSTLSKEWKMYCETIANLAYLAGARDADKARLKKLEKRYQENQAPTQDELIDEVPTEVENERFTL